MTPADRWAHLLGTWAIPDSILASIDASPWELAPAAFEVAERPDRTLLSARVAREIVPPGGSVLDVGCGGGRAAMALVPPASEVFGVDVDAAMLSAFGAAAKRLGAMSETYCGTWPDVAEAAPHADVVVCHHVAYNVAHIERFVRALTTHATIGVVVVLPAVHPMSCWNQAWEHFWGLKRPQGPTSDDFVAVLRSLDIRPERWEMARPERLGLPDDERSRAADACRRLCLAPSRLDEVVEYLGANEPDWIRTHTVLRWAGTSTNSAAADPSGR